MLCVSSRSRLMQRTGEVKFRAFFYHFLHLICKSPATLTSERHTRVYLRSSFTSETGLEFELRSLSAVPAEELIYIFLLKCGEFMYIFYMCIYVSVGVYICVPVIRVQPICGHENRLEQRQRLNLGQFISLLLIMSASWVYSRRTTGFCCHPSNMAIIITTSTITIIIIIITIIITIIIIIIIINNTIGSCFNPGKR